MRELVFGDLSPHNNDFLGIKCNQSNNSYVYTLVNGLLDGIIEVRSLNIHLPQSFLLVDSKRLYLFFFDESQGGIREALRTENQSLTEFFRLIW